MELKVSSIQELNDLFVKQQMDTLPLNIIVNETLEYRNVEHNLKPYGDYHWELYTLKEWCETNDRSPLLFVWKNSKLALVPHVVTPAAVPITEGQRPVIAKHIEISLPQLSMTGIEAKVDTGAGQCCLHAENIKATGETVTFTFGGKRITMNQSDSVDIHTADNGADKRPVVKLNVDCEGGSFKDVEFNLNDRSDMPHKVLLGMNFLKQGQFLVDPLQEGQKIDVDWIDNFVRTL